MAAREDDDPTVEFAASPEAVAGLGRTLAGRQEPDFTITAVKLDTCNIHGFVLSWETESAGFGSVTVLCQPDGSVAIDSEMMGQDFVKEVFSKWIESAKFE